MPEATDRRPPYLWGPSPIEPVSPDVATAHLTAADPDLGRLIERAGRFGLVKPSRATPSHYLQRSIIYQQLSGKAAGTIHRRFLDLFGGQPPSSEQVLATSDAELRAVGLSTAKTRAIRDLALHQQAGRIPRRDALYRLEAEAIVARLTEVRGIGRWTAEMLLIFYLGHADVLPVSDLGVRKGYQLAFRKRRLPSLEALERHGRRWRPYRSVATWYLWRALELPPG
jgi:3-methyladenine DNA glycosylase/8-oxoguanine DNA glycosylase